NPTAPDSFTKRTSPNSCQRLLQKEPPVPFDSICTIWMLRVHMCISWLCAFDTLPVCMICLGLEFYSSIYSGFINLQFQICNLQPGPRDAPLKCFIRRNRAAQSYSLCLGVTDGILFSPPMYAMSLMMGNFLLAARKCRRPACTEYLISLDAKNTSAGSYIGKLRSNFLGTKFTVYDAHPPCARAAVSKGYMIGSAHVSPGVPAGNYPVSHISYYATLGSRVPRKMKCVMDSIPVSAIKGGGTAPTQTEFPSMSSSSFASVPFFTRKPGHRPDSCPGVPPGTQNETKTVLKNKSPRWHQPLQCWCLNFHGRVTVASVKELPAGGGRRLSCLLFVGV
ncbi:hypothetical protein ACJX0J_014492, partial [Zea mays]